MKPPFFWLGRSRLNGMTTPPYPEVTLDTFGFPVGAKWAAWPAVVWHQLPILESKMHITRKVLEGISFNLVVLHSFACHCMLLYGNTLYHYWLRYLARHLSTLSTYIVCLYEKLYPLQ